MSARIAAAEAPLRGSGRCTYCGTHTDDGLVLLIEQESAAGARVIACADGRACLSISKRAKRRR